MAKKRKATGDAYGSKNQGKGSSKLRISTYADVADSEDEFHMNRDKILLEEGPAAKRMRKAREEDEFLQPSDEEVLAQPDLDGHEDEDSEDASESDDETSGRTTKGAEDEEEEDLGGWGPSKKDYYNADAIETEQDALDEEAEALRIQKKQLQNMTEADFGFDEAEWAADDAEVGQQDREAGDVVTKVLPQLEIKESMGVEERQKLLKSRYPEFDHLAKEFLDLQPLHDQLSLAATAAEHLTKHRKSTSTSVTPMAVIKYQALSAYMASLAMYFALLTSSDKTSGSARLAMSPLELRDHPVMARLVECRRLWSKVKDLDITENMAASAGFDVAQEESDVSPDDFEGATMVEQDGGKKESRKKKSKAQRAAEAAQAEAEARRAEKLARMEEELSALSSLANTAGAKRAVNARSNKPAAAAAGDDSDIGEETELTAQELAEKARRKKSLRFYTSQIAQKANKRGASARDYGGDTDIPHKERLRDRQARLMAEAEKRGKKQADTREELGGESDEEDRRQAREIRAEQDGSDSDDYYDMVAARSKKKKAEKQEAAEAYAKAAREGGRVVETETVGTDGKRAITYAIEKNKGLTPHRKKDVRNPRVKKRKKYDEKKKKLKSIRQVYSGGEGRGGYKGELTGIKKGLVKSTKL